MNVPVSDEPRRALFDALGIDPDSAADQPFVTHFNAVASLFPQPESSAHWAVPREGPESQLLIIGADVVLTVQRTDGALVASSQRAVAHHVELSVIDSNVGRTTRWKFWLGRSLEPLHIEGRIDGAGRPNGVEAFARNLARRAGWAGTEEQLPDIGQL